MKKKVEAFLMAVMLVMMTAGCGNSSKMAEDERATVSSGAELDGEYNWDTDEAADTGVTSENGLEAQVENGRKLIRTVSLSLETKEFDSVLTNLSTKTTELGGYIETSSVNGNSYSHHSTRYASYVIRIPADKLNEFVEVVSELGNVTQKNESVEDVTLRYIDVESHKKALETEQERLLELLSKAENMEEILTIESKLSDIRYEIENYESQLKTMDNQIDYSTVSVYIDEVERVTDTGEKGFFEEIKERFGNSLYIVARGIRGLVIGILGSLPILIVCGGVIAVVVIVVRKILKKRNMRKEDRTQNNDIEKI
ncbi:MAG: DUF4349 domain-containing protein [Ruminococcus sp.]|nr:DUF4349 domain-containing protein [Ruminococcus sp.]